MLGAPKASAFSDGDEVGFGQQWTVSFSGATGTLAPSTTIRGGWNLSSAANNGAFAWLTAGDGVLSAADDFTVVYRLNRASAGEAVSFLGIASSANATQATNDIILIQWARGGGSISCITDNGGSETVTDGVVTVADDTDVTFRIEVTSNGGNVKFYVDDALEATHTTNIPTSTALYVMVNELSNSDATTSLHIGDIFAWRTS
jgi:succinyl-CoA synthetase beta subunit